MEERKNIGFEFKKMNHQIGRCLHAKLSECGFDKITIMHGWIMGYLYENRNHVVYQKDMEDEFEISKSTVTNILKLMEKKGYVSRTVDERDARHKIIRLTEQGINVQQNTMDIIDRFHEELEAGISEEEKAEFYRIVEKVSSNLEKIRKEKMYND